MPRDDTLSYDALIRELRRLCLEARTGTLFIATSENHAVRVVLQRGEITHVVARGQMGMAAVASIKQITGGRLTFSEDAIDGGQPQALPTTSELLAMLGGGEPTASGGVATAALLANLQRARAIIEPELTEYLGPMAAMLYEELVARIGRGTGPATFNEAIDHLAGELRNPAKAVRFKDSVRARLAAAAIKAAP
jgi:hypothetical protein